MTFIKLNTSYIDLNKLARVSALSVEEIEHLANKGGFVNRNQKLSSTEKTQLKTILESLNTLVSVEGV